jgi:hypothetical protein
VQHITEAKRYNYEFLQNINQQYQLYGNGARRLIIHKNGIGEIIAYVIMGTQQEPVSWKFLKTTHPTIDDMVEHERL